MRLARAHSRIQKDRGDMKFPLQLAFNGPDPEVGVERLQIRHEDHRVTLAFQWLKDRFESRLQCPSGQGVGERAIRLVPRQRMPGARAAAVLAPLFEEDGETRVVLTRRTTTLPSHRGEVSFPGGKVIAGEDQRDAALREADEEIGLSSAGVEVVAELDHLATVASRFVLAPFAGVLAARPTLTPNPREVDHVFDVALAELLDDEVFREERWRIFGEERAVFFFELIGDTVWGATRASSTSCRRS